MILKSPRTDFYSENRYPLYAISPVTRAELEELFAQAESLAALIQARSDSEPEADESA